MSDKTQNLERVLDRALDRVAATILQQRAPKPEPAGVPFDLSDPRSYSERAAALAGARAPVVRLCRECDRPADVRNYGNYCSRSCLRQADL